MAKRARPQSGRADRKPADLDVRPAIGPAEPVVTWPPAPPPVPAPAAEAVAVFQAGMEALQRKHFEKAAASFRSLITSFAGERALLDRARVYLELCERELQRRPAEPQTIEERITAATAALNNDDDATAERLAKEALDDDPDHDLALYLLTAVEARRGAVDRALELLTRVIELSPEAGQQARFDPDFDALHDSEQFWKLTDKRFAPPSPPNHLRKPRRRPER